MQPFCIIGATVVGKPAATVMTSSPFFNLASPNFHEVNVVNASKFAADPETVNFASLRPKVFASFVSNSSPYLPVVSHISRDASIR